jgi:membrane-bound metal-dependent hydrolase YbcI (DUF457 family)
MFIGHFALGFAGKKLAPKTSLGTLFVAVQFADLLWPVLVLLGVEHVRIEPVNTAFTPLAFTDYPVSHSLIMLVIWGAVFAGIYYAVRRYRAGALVLFAGVVSHWVLDVVVHRPDMPILPSDGPHLGLGLWNSVPATILIESAMFVAGVAIYLRATRALDRAGQIAPWVLAAALYIAYLGASFGPPPPSVPTVAWSANLMWLFVLFAYWFDRHRTPTVSAETA